MLIPAPHRHVCQWTDDHMISSGSPMGHSGGFVVTHFCWKQVKDLLTVWDMKVGWKCSLILRKSSEWCAKQPHNDSALRFGFIVELLMLLGFISVSSHEENSIPSSPQNRFGWKCWSFMALSLSETLLKAVSKHSLDPSGKSLADKQTRRKGIWVFHLLWKTLCAISLQGNSFFGGCRREVAFTLEGYLYV